MSGRKIYGGKNLYGARIGFLMLDVLTPRMPGDVGNATTWPFPVMYGVVPGATPKRVIHEKGAGLLDAFLETADRLVVVRVERFRRSVEERAAIMCFARTTTWVPGVLNHVEDTRTVIGAKSTHSVIR